MRALDLCCYKGGASMGYHLAGFDVTGVDILNVSEDYPFAFVQADAVEYVLEHGCEYDFIHASPPCQTYSALTKGTNYGREYIDILGPMREALIAVGKPWVIENVAGAPLRKDLMLCGEMFGLEVIRHRFFEFSHERMVSKKGHLDHRGRVAGMRHGEWFEGPYFAVYGDGGGKGTIAEWQRAMGIDWIQDRKGLAEAIPPAYTQWIGEEIKQWQHRSRSL